MVRAELCVPVGTEYGTGCWPDLRLPAGTDWLTDRPPAPTKRRCTSGYWSRRAALVAAAGAVGRGTALRWLTGPPSPPVRPTDRLACLIDRLSRPPSLPDQPRPTADPVRPTAESARPTAEPAHPTADRRTTGPSRLAGSHECRMLPCVRGGGWGAVTVGGWAHDCDSDAAGSGLG